MKKSEENKIILYQDDAELYDTTQPNISMHVDSIFNDGELPEEATHKKFLLVQNEGKRQIQRSIDLYNLDMIIAIGYRVQSQIATRFRQWATKRLHEYIQKGFALDDERLKQGGSRYQILNLKRQTLIGNGKITHKQAITKAEKEFEIYRAREMKQLESDFDRAVKELAINTENNGGKVISCKYPAKHQNDGKDYKLLTFKELNTEIRRHRDGK